MRTLYICYFGIREPLVQSQVLTYLREIKRDGVEISLLTFEPELRRRWTKEELDQMSAQLAADGIRWYYLKYHKRPSLPATLYDILAGARLSARLIRTHGIDVLHARNHIAAAIGFLAKRRRGGRLIFDIRGFMPEEYTDAGVWPAGGYLYRLTKAAERRLLKAADGFVVLTERAREILFNRRDDTDSSGRPVEVIPCCVDLKRFGVAETGLREEVRRELNIADRRVFTYVGALGGWYLTDEMADLLALAHERDRRTFSLVLTQSPPEMITERLRVRGIAETDYLVRRVGPELIPRYLQAADITLSFIKPCYSKLSSSPTKVAEYLASGLPIICNSEIGDLDQFIEADRVGVLIRQLNREAYLAGLSAIEELRRDPGLSARCRATAKARFDLETIGGERYRRLYRRLSESPNKVARPQQTAGQVAP